MVKIIIIFLIIIILIIISIKHALTITTLSPSRYGSRFWPRTSWRDFYYTYWNMLQPNASSNATSHGTDSNRERAARREERDRARMEERDREERRRDMEGMKKEGGGEERERL